MCISPSRGQCPLLWQASAHSYVATVRAHVRLCSVETLETGEKATKTKRATVRQRESNSSATLKWSEVLVRGSLAVSPRYESGQRTQRATSVRPNIIGPNSKKMSMQSNGCCQQREERLEARITRRRERATLPTAADAVAAAAAAEAWTAAVANRPEIEAERAQEQRIAMIMGRPAGTSATEHMMTQVADGARRARVTSQALQSARPPKTATGEPSERGPARVQTEAQARPAPTATRKPSAVASALRT